MTLTELQAMSDDQLRIEVAKAEGWRVSTNGCFKKEQRINETLSETTHVTRLPNYLSLDEAWKLIPKENGRKQYFRFFDILDDVIGADNDRSTMEMLARIDPRSAARAICQAFILSKEQSC